MRAVRLHDALDLRVEAIAPPGPPPPGYANIRIGAAGICGSDLHNFRTGQWISRRPSVAGHEFCGVVTALGTGVETLAVGDAVVADSRVWCGECAACRSGLTQVCERLAFVGEVCDGGFAEETQLPVRLLHKYPSSLSPQIACMAEPLAVALHAVRRLDARPGEPVLVVGCGPIGGLSALLLDESHDGQILLADRNDRRAATVAELCSGTVVEATGEAVARALGERPLRYAIDATGSVGLLSSLIELLAGSGALALVGIAHGRLDLDPNVLVEKELALLGCHAFQDELPEAVARLEGLAPKLRRFFDEAIPLAAVPDAYHRLSAGNGAGLKTVIDPSL